MVDNKMVAFCCPGLGNWFEAAQAGPGAMLAAAAELAAEWISGGLWWCPRAMEAPAAQDSGRGQRSQAYMAQFPGVGELDTRLKDGSEYFTSFAEFKDVRSTGFGSKEAGPLDTCGASREGGVQGGIRWQRTGRLVSRLEVGRIRGGG